MSAILKILAACFFIICIYGLMYSVRAMQIVAAIFIAVQIILLFFFIILFILAVLFPSLIAKHLELIHIISEFVKYVAIASVFILAYSYATQTLHASNVRDMPISHHGTFSYVFHWHFTMAILSFFSGLNYLIISIFRRYLEHLGLLRRVKVDTAYKPGPIMAVIHRFLSNREKL